MGRTAKKAPALRTAAVESDFTFDNVLRTLTRFNRSSVVYTEVNRETLAVSVIIEDELTDKKYTLSGTAVEEE